MRKNRTSLLYTTAAAAMMLAFFAAVAWPWHGVSLWEWESRLRSGHVVYSARTSRPVVALTFDDGPDPRYTPAVLDILRTHHVRATFFVCGCMVRKHPELLRRIVGEGHVIGNHTETHAHLERERDRDIRSELDGCRRDIQAAVHLRPTLFRPPRGLWNRSVYSAARNSGCDVVLWSLAFERDAVRDKSILARRVIRLARPGDIILMHDGSTSPRDVRSGTVRELDTVLAGLERRGFQFATVPELIHPRSRTQLASGR